MSLSRALFTMSLAEQEAAIKVIAAKAIQYADQHQFDRRSVFNSHIRPLTRVKHQAGASKEELREIQKRFRFWFHEVERQPELAALPTVSFEVGTGNERIGYQQ